MTHFCLKISFTVYHSNMYRGILILFWSIIIAGLILSAIKNSSEAKDDYLRKEYIQRLVVELPEEIHEATEEDTLITIKKGDTIYVMYN